MRAHGGFFPPPAEGHAPHDRKAHEHTAQEQFDDIGVAGMHVSAHDGREEHPEDAAERRELAARVLTMAAHLFVRTGDDGRRLCSPSPCFPPNLTHPPWLPPLFPPLFRPAGAVEAYGRLLSNLPPLTRIAARGPKRRLLRIRQAAQASPPRSSKRRAKENVDTSSSDDEEVVSGEVPAAATAEHDFMNADEDDDDDDADAAPLVSPLPHHWGLCMELGRCHERLAQVRMRLVPSISCNGVRTPQLFNL